MLLLDSVSAISLSESKSKPTTGANATAGGSTAVGDTAGGNTNAGTNGAEVAGITAAVAARLTLTVSLTVSLAAAGLVSAMLIPTVLLSGDFAYKFGEIGGLTGYHSTNCKAVQGADSKDNTQLVLI